MQERIKEIVQSRGAKKILSCDGGGILGLMTVEILAKLEADLREKEQKEDLVLADYFDFVCGTSTGAIVATCISCGMSMGQIREFYKGSGKEMFDRASIWKRYTRYGYNDEPLAKKLQKEINKALGHKGGDNVDFAKLGDENLKTVLMIVMRNQSTDSPWPVSNNPFAKYNDISRKDCNLYLPLWQLVRASTAAPTFFPPELVTFAEGEENEYSFVFVDGGVTTYNNPAYLAFQMATAAPYKMNWKTGEDKLLIVSVGTGDAPKERLDLDGSAQFVLSHAKSIPSALMNAASAGWDMTCRTLGRCTFGGVIDREVGDMVMDNNSDSNFTGEKLFTYVRYNPDTTKKGLEDLKLGGIKPENIQELDSIKYMDDIQKVGKAYAKKYVHLKHLRTFV